MCNQFTSGSFGLVDPSCKLGFACLEKEKLILKRTLGEAKSTYFETHKLMTTGKSPEELSFWMLKMHSYILDLNDYNQ